MVGELDVMSFEPAFDVGFLIGSVRLTVNHLGTEQVHDVPDFVSCKFTTVIHHIGGCKTGIG
ncbi:hypothetical protein D3C80_2010740 [compost metagenome]